MQHNVWLRLRNKQGALLREASAASGERRAASGERRAASGERRPRVTCRQGTQHNWRANEPIASRGVAKTRICGGKHTCACMRISQKTPARASSRNHACLTRFTHETGSARVPLLKVRVQERVSACAQSEGSTRLGTEFSRMRVCTHMCSRFLEPSAHAWLRECSAEEQLGKRVAARVPARVFPPGCERPHACMH
eukprot:6060043-Pleurochrysis_carterae.AAC.4